MSDDSGAEYTGNSVTSFETDGFTVGTGNSNNDGGTYVAWNWDMGGSNASNTDGTITSTVRANPTYGQSIVSYTGNGTNGATIGHGLSSAPEMVIIKNRENTSGTNWAVYFHTLADTQGIALQSTSAATTENWFNNTDPTSTIVELRGAGTVNENTKSHIAYCFHSVTGYSKFGSYTGNGSSSGATVTLGFRPAFIMIKCVSHASDWRIWDNMRNNTTAGTNSSRQMLANTTAVENATLDIRFTDTGFIPKTADGEINGSGKTYIYMTFADKREYAFWLDQSGNNNDWARNNLTESDISVDSPTNNFATWNPLTIGTQGTLSEGNLKNATFWSADLSGNASTFIPKSGKWYWEIRVDGVTTYPYLGITSQEKIGYNSSGGTFYNIAWHSAGTSASSGTGLGTITKENISSFTNGDIISFALDVDSRKLWVAKNNTWADSGNPSNGSGENASWTVDAGVSPFISGYQSQGVGTVANFGQDSSFAGNKTAQGNQDGNDIGDFYYTPPTGFLALCTKNLPDVAVVPSEHFNIVVYSGTGSNNNSVTVGFNPSFTWIKSRSGGRDNILVDQVRGNTKLIASNTTGAEETGTTDFQSFDSNGFTVGTPSTTGGTNTNGESIISFNWKANGSGSTDNSGNNNATVSANTDAKFSVVAYTGTGGEPKTVAHGLGVSPEMVIIKKRNNTANWVVWHKDLADNYAFEGLNTTGAAVSGGSPISKYVDAVSSTLVTLGDASENNGSGDTFIMYCWASVDGYSKVGSYTGNGNADGTFVYTGFDVKWLLIKRTDTSGNGWVMLDNQRSEYNPVDDVIYAHLSNAEVTNHSTIDVDYVSNGFKTRGTNTSINGNGGTYIYIAFAETPFKNSNAR